MKKTLILALLTSFMLVGCNNTPTPEPSPEPEPGPSGDVETDDDFKRELEYDSKLVKEEKQKMEVHYLTDDFKGDNRTYNNNLAINSLAASVASYDVNVATKFFTDLKFKDLHFAKGYDSEQNDELIAYTFASKELDDKLLVAVSIRGIDYDKLEVIDDFRLGREGEHEGFASAAAYVSSSLKEYLDNYAETQQFKFWISGYSRAGAVGGLLAKEILNDPNAFNTNADDVYAYTFEAPNYGVDDEASLPAIHSIINTHDFITYVPPTRYGFLRYGTLKDITNENDVEIINAMYPNAKIEPFAERELNLSAGEDEETFPVKEDGNTDPIVFYDEFMEFIYENLQLIEDDETVFSLLTRSDYVSFFQSILDVNLKDLLSEENLEKFSHYDEILTDEEKDNLKNQFMALILKYYFGSLEENDMYDIIIKPLLDKFEVEYPEDDVKEICRVLQKLIFQLIEKYGDEMSDMFPSITGKVATLIGNFDYIYAMHCPETTYALLKA